MTLPVWCLTKLIDIKLKLLTAVDFHIRVGWLLAPACSVCTIVHLRRVSHVLFFLWRSKKKKKKHEKRDTRNQSKSIWSIVSHNSSNMFRNNLRLSIRRREPWVSEVTDAKFCAHLSCATGPLIRIVPFFFFFT
jgi:hypothetical protein